MTLIYKNVPTLVKEATKVLRVKVLDTRSEWAPGKWTIDTYVTLVASDGAKGTFSTEPFLIRLEGGTVGETTLSIPGLPQFAVGQEYLLFLRDMRTARTCPLVGWPQGVFQVSHDEQGQEILLDSGGNHVLGLEEGKVVTEQPATQPEDILILSDQSAAQPISAAPAPPAAAPMSPAAFFAEIRKLVAEQPPAQPEDEEAFITDTSQFLPLEPLVAAPPPQVLAAPTEAPAPAQPEEPLSPPSKAKAPDTTTTEESLP